MSSTPVLGKETAGDRYDFQGNQVYTDQPGLHSDPVSSNNNNKVSSTENAGFRE